MHKTRDALPILGRPARRMFFLSTHQRFWCGGLYIVGFFTAMEASYRLGSKAAISFTAFKRSVT